MKTRISAPKQKAAHIPAPAVETGMFQRRAFPNPKDEEEQEENIPEVQMRSNMPALQLMDIPLYPDLQREEIGEEYEEEDNTLQKPVQAKLTIGQPGDKYEQEADAMAAKVMRMPDPVLQRQSDEEEEEGMMQLRAKPQIQAKGSEAPAVPEGFASRLAQNRSGGKPLSDETRAFMEPRFGSDFSGVRIHETPDLANSIQAQAFTHGQDIYFNSGKYNPGSSSGKELLAHELTHVEQQNDLSEQPASIQKWDSPEHVELGDKAGIQSLNPNENGSGGEKQLIVLDCHRLDIPDFGQPIEYWSEKSLQKWQSKYKKFDSDQKRALTKGLTYGEVVALSGDFYESFDALNQAPLLEIIELVPLIRKEGTTTEQLQETTGGRYLDLAKKNENHFSNVRKGHRNIDEWRKLHIKAIKAAKKGDANRAWGLNAAADHFLTDAFSGGHIRVPRYNLLQEGLSGQLDSTLLHDLDNEHGVKVTNHRGDKPWIAYGDDFLKDEKNSINRKKLIEAVTLSKNDIQQAINNQGETSDVDISNIEFEAERLVPFPVDGEGSELPDYYQNRMDRSMASGELIKKEGFYFLKSLLIEDIEDAEVRDWIKKHDLKSIARQPESQIHRMQTILALGFGVANIMENIAASNKIDRALAWKRHRISSENGDENSSQKSKERPLSSLPVDLDKAIRNNKIQHRWIGWATSEITGVEMPADSKEFVRWVVDFQKQNGLVEDGIFGPESTIRWAEINGEKDTAIYKRAQRQLRKKDSVTIEPEVPVIYMPPLQ